MTTHWSAADLAMLNACDWPQAPLIRPGDAPRLITGIDLWDHWAVQEEDGRTAEIAAGALVMLLAAPMCDDPDDRHVVARIRLMHRTASGWTDLGPALPDGFSPGSREWAGSAIVDPDHRRITLFFTAAGVRGEARPSFGQEMFETRAALSIVDGRVRVDDWSVPRPCCVNDGALYMRDVEGGGRIGTIKAYRDPAFFRDPADRRDYLLFSASLAGSASPWNGAIGIAARSGDSRSDKGWTLLPPLVEADGVNNELERPHVVVSDGLYYLFWSTQRKVFAGDGISGPNGLYGMVAHSLSGPWSPLNKTGLVFANPAAAPYQAYSWLVSPDLVVSSFADLVGLARPARDAAEARAAFGGTPAPELRLRLARDTAMLA